MHLHLDCFAGIAGDMTLGALIDLGASAETVERELRKLQLGEWSMSFERRSAGHGMTGMSVEIAGQALASDQPEPPDAESHRISTATQHGHSHNHRPYTQIVEIIRDANLAPNAELRALSVFRRIAEAEARVHGLSTHAVTFHEVGAIDSIVDIVGTAIALDCLEVESISSSPLPLGHGFTKSRHGRIPLPAPATLECLKGVPCYDSGLAVELVTPTGAAIIGALATTFTYFPTMTLDRVGYGVGSRRHADRPNLVRAVLGHAELTGADEVDEMWEVAANIDDQTPEELAQAIAAVWDAGALDVWMTPIVMKKGRLAHQLSALCSPQHRERTVETILRHTTSLGVRLARLDRVKLAREHVDVSTPYGSIGVKVGRGRDGATWNLAPEADDCARAAKQHGVPMKVVRQAAIAAALKAKDKI